jgi:Trypsin-like peptidase domain
VQNAGGVATGTGFLFAAPVGQNQHLPLLVTNKHVVEGGLTLKTQVHRADGAGQPILDQSEVFTVAAPGGQFVPHPSPDVDLCALPIGPLIAQAQAQGRPLFTPWLDSSLIPAKDKLGELTAAEEVIMVGYPIGLWDAANNLPLLRRGMTASHPFVAFNGKPWGVIDAACFPGSSGSPVLIVNEGTFAPKGGGIVLGTRVMLLGVLFGGPQYEPDGRIEIRPIPTATVPVPVVRQMLHLGYYVKAESVKELADIIVQKVASTQPTKP